MKDSTTVTRTNLDQKWKARSEPRILTSCDILRCPCRREAESHSEPIWSELIVMFWRAKDELLHAFEPRLATRARKYLSESRIGVPRSFHLGSLRTHRGDAMTELQLWNVCQMPFLVMFDHVWSSAICRILPNLLSSILLSHGFAANYFAYFKFAPVLHCRRAPRKIPGATVAFVCWLERSAHRSTVSHSGVARCRHFRFWFAATISCAKRWLRLQHKKEPRITQALSQKGMFAEGERELLWTA